MLTILMTGTGSTNHNSGLFPVEALACKASSKAVIGGDLILQPFHHMHRLILLCHDVGFHAATARAWTPGGRGIRYLLECNAPVAHQRTLMRAYATFLYVGTDGYTRQVNAQEYYSNSKDSTPHICDETVVQLEVRTHGAERRLKDKSEHFTINVRGRNCFVS